MKFNWDKKYIQIGIHVIATIVVAYIAINLVDVILFLIGDIFTPGEEVEATFFGAVFRGIGRFFVIFRTVIIAFGIAYLLDPMVDFYQKHFTNFNNNILDPWVLKNASWIYKLQKNKYQKADSLHKGRLAGSLLTYITVFGFIYFVTGLLVRHFAEGEGGGLTEVINNTGETLTTLFNNILAFFDDLGMLGVAGEALEGLTYTLQQTALGFVGDVLPGIMATGMLALDIFISLVVAFYFMNHKHRLQAGMIKLLKLFTKERHSQKILNILGDINFVFSGYIRGLILGGIILGTMAAIALTIIGSQLAIPIGILTAMFNLIPFFGGIVAFVLSVGFELILGTTTSALWAGVAIIIVQQIDNIFIVPKVIGENVKLSAPVVLISLTIAGNLFGVAGMFLIVPTIAIVKMFAERYLERYSESKS